MTEQNQISAYRSAALALEAAFETEGPDTGNQHARELESIAGTLRSAGRGRELLFLLDDESATVRLWAATHTLDLDTPRALKILEALDRGMGVTAIQAAFVLERWAEGEVKFPG